MGKASRKKASQEMAGIKDRHGYVENIVLLDKDGNVLSADDLESAIKIDFKSDPLFQQSMSGKTVVSDPRKSERSGATVIIISAPIKENGEVIGVLFDRAILDVMSKKLIDPVKPGDTGYAYMMKNDGLVIAYPDKSKILELNLSGFDFGKRILESKNGNIVYTYDGIKKLVIYSSSEKLGWTLGITVPEKELFSSVTSLGRINVLMTVMVALVTVLLVFIVANLITNRLNGLRDAAEGEGDLTKRIEINTEDEVGELARWFNAFVSKLQGIITEVTNNANQLDSSSKELSEVATNMTQGAVQAYEKTESVASATTQVNDNLSSVAAAMEQATSNMNMIAAAGEEMNNTINEIARNTSGALTATTDAVEKSNNASSQVKLLALDATNKTNYIVDSIATAVEEQSATTKEISENVSQASAGVSEVNENVAQSSAAVDAIAGEIAEVNLATAELSNSSAQVSNKSGQLAGLAERLNELVNRFVI